MIQQVRDALLSWYEKHGRHELPWRNTEDVYHIYLSEVMLQQTQVKRVMEEYYPRFLEKFPTLGALSLAKEEEVLALWSGLGYYSRARNLHATAKLCPNTLPKTQKELVKLPGIGRYTASAICSFAYHQRVGVVDTNIERVIKRFFAHHEQSDALIWQSAEEFVNPVYPTLHNQALMDLGSLVCTATNPKCGECPLEPACRGKEEAEFYTRRQKKVYEALELFYGIAVQEGKIALKISKGPMYKGMLELPAVEPIEEDFIAEFKHSYTKYRLTVKLYKLAEVQDDVLWFEKDALKDAHISSLTRKVLKYLEDIG
ncbi:A/G-specific adenine glycosylase [Sulfurimonas sp. HSL-1716]|uniref:A/G-specific adenine glycosylase n=1 Tax=Hydrocurvibacter sulfurireducens TaxID=3131937 RepID=UPI0031F8072F